MSNRGPKPTAHNVLKLRQSRRANRRGVVIKLDQNKPQRPLWLKGEAKKYWERIVPILYKSGLATQLNRETLTLLCCAWEDFVEAREMLSRDRNENGDRKLKIETEKGFEMRNPLLSICAKAYDQLFKAAACFGMTPADLAGVKPTDIPEENSIKSKFFKKMDKNVK